MMELITHNFSFEALVLDLLFGSKINILNGLPEELQTKGEVV
jgi:hypothetical protein